MYIYFVIEINLQIHKKLLSLRRVSGHSRFVYALNENEKAKFLPHFPYISLNREEDSRHFYFQRRLPMKKFSSFSLRFFSSLNASASPVSSDGCFKGIPLRVKVKIVDHFPDSKVKVVSSFPAAAGCGEGGDDFGRIYTPK